MLNAQWHISVYRLRIDVPESADDEVRQSKDGIKELIRCMDFAEMMCMVHYVQMSMYLKD